MPESGQAHIGSGGGRWISAVSGESRGPGPRTPPDGDARTKRLERGGGLGSVIAPQRPDPDFQPPAVFGRADDSHFGAGVAFFRAPPHRGGFAAIAAEVDGTSAVSAQRFDTEGCPVGGWRALGDPTDAPTASDSPLAAALDDGWLAASWPAAEGGLWLALLAPAIDAVPNMLRLRDDDRPRATVNAIARFGEEGFALSWTFTDDTAAAQYFLQCFNADGAPTNARLETPGPASIARLDSNRLVAAWSTSAEQGAGRIVAAVQDRTDATHRVIIAVGAGTDGDGATAAALEDGGFVVTWREIKDGKIRGRRFGPDSAALSSVFSLPAGAEEALAWGETAHIYSGPERELMISWTTGVQDLSAPVVLTRQSASKKG